MCLELSSLFSLILSMCLTYLWFFIRYVLYTAYTLTTAITEWSSVLYSVIYTAVPTVVVGILDKDLSRRTLLKYPKLYAAGQREERYNLRLFFLTMMDAVWQGAMVFFLPYLAYRDTSVDGSSLGDLWTLAVVILVNIHLALDVFRWNWITHASIWGSIIATALAVIVIDSIWFLPGYWYSSFTLISMILIVSLTYMHDILVSYFFGYHLHWNTRLSALIFIGTFFLFVWHLLNSP